MRTLEYLEPAKQHRISRETLDIYAPIALRLGMSVVRGDDILRIKLAISSSRALHCRIATGPSRKIFSTESCR